MWTIEAVRRYVDLGTNKEGQQVGFWDTHHIARNQAGIAIYSIGGGREHQERFQYEGPEISFDFWADRYDGYGRLTDTYRVPMILPGKLSLSEARAIETRIREALLALPPQPIVHEGRPPTAVVFDWRLWNRANPDAQVIPPIA